MDYFEDESVDICHRSNSKGELIPQWKKYRHYDREVDPEQNDRATEIRIFDFSRPHMRAFHCAWWSFFVAFFNWFAITPLLLDIRHDLGLSKFEVWTSSIISVGGTILIRFILGPLCDKYGARVLFLVVLCATAIPTACTGLIQTAQDLYILRLFIGLAGGTFVMCEFWSTTMFADEIVGTANGLVAGWGNLGAGITQLVIGSGLYPLFNHINGGCSEKAWRTVCIVPALLSFLSGVVVYFISDDCPKGNYNELKKRGSKPEVVASKSFKKAFYDLNTWILFLQYACSFGVELTMNNAAAFYFRDEFLLSTEAAAAIASLFGWMNLFGRALGGFVSDYGNSKHGMIGRIVVNFVLLAMEGFLVLVFATTHTLASSIITLVFFSLFVQAAEGATYGIVPFVNPSAPGAVSGIVGAGGNVGAVCFGLAFREMDPRSAFSLVGGTVLAISFLSFFINIKGHSNVQTFNPLNSKSNEMDPTKSSSGDATQEHAALTP